MKPHKHAAIIKAWADGAEIEVLMPEGGWLRVYGIPYWDYDSEYRIKPKRPEPKYPKTRMTVEEISKVYLGGPGDPHDCFIHVADWVIARAIQDGDVVPAAMLEAVAKEVQKAYLQCIVGGGGFVRSINSVRDEHGGTAWAAGDVGSSGGGSGFGAGSIVPVVVVDIAAIIKRVKEGK